MYKYYKNYYYVLFAVTKILLKVKLSIIRQNIILFTPIIKEINVKITK